MDQIGWELALDPIELISSPIYLIVVSSLISKKCEIGPRLTQIDYGMSTINRDFRYSNKPRAELSVSVWDICLLNCLKIGCRVYLSNAKSLCNQPISFLARNIRHIVISEFPPLFKPFCLVQICDILVKLSEYAFLKMWFNAYYERIGLDFG